MSKKHPNLALEFSSLVESIRSSDLYHADEVIAFLIFHANTQSVSINPDVATFLIVFLH